MSDDEKKEKKVGFSVWSEKQMDNPNQRTLAESINDNSLAGWERVAAMANKYPEKDEFVDPAKFEKPAENFNTIASVVVEYAHCDLDKKKGFYDAVMTSGVERWYPGIRASKNPARDRFESARFEEWKKNIINMDTQTAIEKYGRGDTFNALKKIHNYLKSGQNAKTQAELLMDCFSGDDNGFDVAFDRLRYDRHSGGGWMYYSSRDEKLGLEKHINADGRLYLNAEPGDTFDIADKFVNACKKVKLPYEFKINQFPDRSDAMVFYIDNNDVGDYVEIISRILDENPKISQRVGRPPLLSEKVTEKIGYGDETGGESYNERQCKKFQEVIEAVANSYRGEALQGSTQERAKFLYINHYEKFISTIKDRL